MGNASDDKTLLSVSHKQLSGIDLKNRKQYKAEGYDKYAGVRLTVTENAVSAALEIIRDHGYPMSDNELDECSLAQEIRVNSRAS